MCIPRFPAIKPALEEAGGAEDEDVGAVAEVGGAVAEVGGAVAEVGGAEAKAGGAEAGVGDAGEDIDAVCKLPASGARALRPRAGGAAAWSRSESEAEDGAIKVPVEKRVGAKKVRIEYGENGGAGSSRGRQGGQRQEQDEGILQQGQGEQGGQEDARPNLFPEDFSNFTVPTAAARGRGRAGAERGRAAGGRGGGRAAAGGRGRERAAAEGRDRVPKRLFWFHTAAAGTSPERKRRRTEKDEEETSDDGSSEDSISDIEEEDVEHYTTGSEIECEEDLLKGFKESRKKITNRKREQTRRARMIVKAAKMMDEEDDDSAEDEDDDYDGGDEDYLPPQDRPRKSTRGPGRRSFLSLHMR